MIKRTVATCVWMCHPRVAFTVRDISFKLIGFLESLCGTRCAVLLAAAAVRLRRGCRFMWRQSRGVSNNYVLSSSTAGRPGLPATPVQAEIRDHQSLVEHIIEQMLGRLPPCAGLIIGAVFSITSRDKAWHADLSTLLVTVCVSLKIYRLTRSLSVFSLFSLLFRTSSYTSS